MNVDSDYLYEVERDDRDMKKIDEKALNEQNKTYLQVNAECFYCNLEFPIDDMDKKDGEWICRNCEEKQK